MLSESNGADMISRGLGRSYGDSALNTDRGVLVHRRQNRFLSFDEQAGILECEAGVSFAEIIDCFLPRGWFLPTTPGTKFVTVGGAIAADVHGKNHHVDGSFGNFVLHLDLLTADGQVIRCSPVEHPEIFWATIGGMGLTGVIVSACFRLRRVDTAYCNVTLRRTANLDETLECFAATDGQYEHSVAWIDCLRTGKSLGRSVVILGSDAKRGDLAEGARDQPLRIPPRRETTIPLNLPSMVLNPLSVKAFNSLYYSLHGNRRHVVDFDKFFYPLDGILNWNRMYGRRGFVQYQALFPKATSRPGLVELLGRISASQAGSFLAVLKTSGAATRGPLSYLFPGHTLALDFPNTGAKLQRLTRQLDEILLKFGGRLYLAKDALMTADTFSSMYPRLSEFKELKATIDPNNRFVSSQARRVGIVETD